MPYELKNFYQLSLMYGYTKKLPGPTDIDGGRNRKKTHNYRILDYHIPKYKSLVSSIGIFYTVSITQRYGTGTVPNSKRCIVIQYRGAVLLFTLDYDLLAEVSENPS
jgi:hypothetical protein